MDFGFSEKTSKQILDVFDRYLELKKVKIYGSRAKGTAHQSSDIDFALWGDLSDKNLMHLYSDLDDLQIPYKFDLTLYESLQHEGLKRHIDRVGKDFFIRDRIENDC